MNKTQINPDEFVFEDVKMIHWENMNESSYWAGITLNDGRYFHLNIHGDNLRVYLTDETPDEVSTGHRRKDLDVL
jgi:hypothetical protein